MRIRDTRYHLEAVAHGDEEDTVKSALSELYKVDDIIKPPANGLRREST
jgi:hypothetical protein